MSYRAYRRRLSVDFAAIEKLGNLGRLWLQVSRPGAQRGRSRNVAWIRHVAGGQLSAEGEIRPVEPRWPLKLINISIVNCKFFKISLKILRTSFNRIEFSSCSKNLRFLEYWISKSYIPVTKKLINLPSKSLEKRKRKKRTASPCQKTLYHRDKLKK